MGTTAKRGRRYRARVAPRRRSRRTDRSRGSRVHWDKVGRIALVLVLFAVLASYVKPTVNLIGTWSDTRATEGRLAELREENASLERRLRALDNPAETLKEARRLGYVAENEQAYVIDR